ncbi:hypothetical protein AA650_07760 [Anabaena sp. WA102]|nr:hypothetical protein AA650_07760 [Anabaena sp. WA102]
MLVLYKLGQGRREAGGQGREEQKFFPIITRQNKFDRPLVTKMRKILEFRKIFAFGSVLWSSVKTKC